MFLKSNKNIFLSILSGLLLSLSWNPNLTFLIFIAWIPLLQVAADNVNEKLGNRKIFGLAYLCFLIWNIGVTWWISHASLGGAAMAILTNSLFMSLVFLLFFILLKKTNKPFSIWIFLPLWLAFEYLHLDWDLSWPWLNLGNVFAFQTDWIQWYEYTGVAGGSAWIITVNLLLVDIFQKRNLFQRNSILTISFAILFPIILSQVVKKIALFSKYKSSPLEVVVVQPNLDPYSEKFYMEPEDQFKILLIQISGKINKETDYLILPETYLTENIWENQIQESRSASLIRDSVLKKFPNLCIVSGGSSLIAYSQNTKTSTARKFKDGSGFFDYFNSAMQFDHSPTIKLYHKSKLVPGVEKMPFPALFKPLEAFALDLGGTSGSLGTQEEREVFEHPNKKACIAPVICYESIYGEYVSDYISKGANLICILTNDGWWEDTPGYKQHLAYGILRAIENRKQIARSANTGISCFIDEYGNCSEKTSWWKEAVIRKTIYPNTYKSFYSKYGDVLSKLSLLFIGFILIYFFWLKFSNK